MNDFSSNLVGSSLQTIGLTMKMPWYSRTGSTWYRADFPLLSVRLRPGLAPGTSYTVCWLTFVLLKELLFCKSLVHQGLSLIYLASISSTVVRPVAPSCALTVARVIMKVKTPSIFDSRMGRVIIRGTCNDKIRKGPWVKTVILIPKPSRSHSVRFSTQVSMFRNC